MTHRLRRCKHCKRTYFWQASGYGAERYNDKTYCSECKEVVETALSKIPVILEERMKEIKVDQKTIDNVISLEKEYRKHLEKEGNFLGGLVHRVFFTAENEKTITYGIFPFDYANKKIEDMKNNKVYFYPNEPTLAMIINTDKKTIKVPWEYDLEKNEFGENYWRE